MSILLYVLTMLAVYYGLTSIPAFLIARVISYFAKKTSGIFTGCLTSWGLIDFIWLLTTRHHIPILAFLLIMIEMYIISVRQVHFLSEDYKLILGGEFFAILTIIAYLAYKGHLIWY